MIGLKARLAALREDKSTATKVVALSTGGTTFTTDTLIRASVSASDIVAYASTGAKQLGEMYGLSKQVENGVKTAKAAKEPLYVGVFSYGENKFVKVGTSFVEDSQEVEEDTITPRRLAGLISRGALVLYRETTKTRASLTPLANLINPYGINHGFDVDVSRLDEEAMQFVLLCKLVTTIGFDSIVSEDPSTAFAIAKYRLLDKNIVPLKLHGGIVGAEALGGMSLHKQMKFLADMPAIYQIIKERGMHRVESKTFKEGGETFKFEQLELAPKTMDLTKRKIGYLVKYAKAPAQTKTIREAKIDSVLSLLDAAGTTEMDL